MLVLGAANFNQKKWEKMGEKWGEIGENFAGRTRRANAHSLRGEHGEICKES